MSMQPVLRDHTIQALSGREATAEDLGVTTAFCYTLVHNGFLRPSGFEKRCQAQGRPQRTFRLTPKGRGRARTLARIAA